MGEIRLSVGQINISGYLIINIREVQNPGSVVATQTVPPPVPAIQNFVFTGLNDVVHYVDFRESPDGVSLGTLLATYVYDALNMSTLGITKFYKTGGLSAVDPAPGSTTIIDPFLAGKNITRVFKEGFRDLIPDEEYTFTGNTITLLASGAVLDPALSDQEVMVVELAAPVAASSSTASSNFPKDVITVTSNITLSNTHYNNLIEAAGSSSVLTITFPSLMTIPDGVKFGFNTDAGNQRYLAIVFPPGGYCRVGKVQRGIVYLGQGEQIVMIKKGNGLVTVNWSGDHLRVGDRISKDGTPPLNSIAEIGGWYLKSEYPRLWEWYINTLPPGDILNVADDTVLNPVQAAKWAVGTTKFWVPDRRGFTDKIAIGSRRAGDVEGPQVGQFDLTLTKGNGFSGNPSPADVNKFAYGSANPVGRTVLVNSGLENRVLNAAVFTYRII